MRARRAVIAFALASVAGVGELHAQERAVDAAFAETLRQATVALERGDFAEAISLCEGAARVRVTASVRYCLAWSHHRRDEPVEAYVEARNCQRALAGEADPQRRQWIQGRCDEVVRLRQPQVARVRLVIEGDTPPGLRVSVNGREVPAAVLGLEQPVRAGAVTVHAEATGYEAVDERLDVAGDQGRVVTLRLRRVPTSAAPQVAPVVMRRRVWEAVLGGALALGGAAAAGVGAYSLAAHGTEVSDAATGTIEQRCALGAPVQDTAQGPRCDGVGVAAPLMVGAGAVALGVGVFLLWDGLRERPVSWGRLRPSVDVGRSSVSLGAAVAF